jgi:hypothetical protein
MLVRLAYTFAAPVVARSFGWLVERSPLAPGVNMKLGAG